MLNFAETISNALEQVKDLTRSEQNEIIQSTIKSFYSEAVANVTPTFFTLINQGVDYKSMLRSRHAVTGETALHMLVRRRLEESCREILKTDPSIALKDANGMTALDYAVQGGNLEIVYLLSQYAPCHEKSQAMFIVSKAINLLTSSMHDDMEHKGNQCLKVVGILLFAQFPCSPSDYSRLRTVLNDVPNTNEDKLSLLDLIETRSPIATQRLYDSAANSVRRMR